MILCAPRNANIAAAIAKARAGTLRTVHVDSLTVDQLATLEFVGPVLIDGNKAALDILRARHQIIFANKE